jgi:TPP-dependent pyruvate/acetoin dehydrogenase alpha subunit
MVTTIDPILLRKMYRGITLTKAFNGRLVELKAQGQVPGPVHQTEGQEAVGIGTCAALDDNDYVVGYYRSYAEWIYRGSDLRRLAAEILGRGTGLCNGKGGEMTLADTSVGIMSCSGIIGGSIPTGVGVALGALHQNRKQVAMIYFGDGAVNTGAFHEGVNMAAKLELPAIFVCLNNQWGITTCIYDTLAGGSIAKRADGYGIPGVQVDGQDVIALYEAARHAVERARAGHGPTLIEAITYRIGGHSSTSPDFKFMDMELMEQFKARDPLRLLRARMIGDGVASAQELDAIERDAAAESERAVSKALRDPWPVAAEATRRVFA